MRLQDIDFGKDTAEFDANLKEYFIQTQAFKSVRSGHKSILVGRKGTGKTAIAKYCSDDENPSREYVIIIEATHTTYTRIEGSLRKFQAHTKNLDTTFRIGWLVTAMFALLNRIETEQSISLLSDEKRVLLYAQKQLGYRHEDPFAGLAGYLLDWVKRLQSIGPLRRDTTPQDTTQDTTIDEAELLPMIKNLTQRINKKGRRVYLFFDKLDERWDGSDLYVAFLQGLLIAARDLRALGLELYPVVLVRDDIFERVMDTFQHSDHFRMEIEYIRWDEDALIELIAQRIVASTFKETANIGQIDPITIWSRVFTESVPAKRQPIAPHAYLIERTLFRPRDVILFASKAVEEARRARHESILANDIRRAEKDYSRMKLRDLVSEQSFQYPGLREVMEAFRRSVAGFFLDDFRIKLMEIREQLGAEYQWLHESEDDLLRILYKLALRKAQGA